MRHQLEYDFNIKKQRFGVEFWIPKLRQLSAALDVSWMQVQEAETSKNVKKPKEN